MSSLVDSLSNNLPSAFDLSSGDTTNLIGWSVLGHMQFLAAVTLLLALVVKCSKPPRQGKPLPGPVAIPWAGPVWAFESKIYRTFTAWAERFGSIYQVQIFGTNFIIISDPQTAKDILAKNAGITSDRPSVAVVAGSRTSGKYLPFLGRTEILRIQRRFAVSLLTNTHQAKYHDRVLPETIRFVHRLLKQRNDPFTLLEECCGRISSRMAFGTPAPHSGIARSAHNLMKNLSPGGRTTNVMQFLRVLPTSLNPELHDEMMRVEIEDRVWNSNVAKAKAGYKAGTLKPCYAKYYFDNAERTGLTEQEAVYGISMMATVSIITISAPVQRWIVVMAEHPEWQKAVQKELKEQMNGRLVEFSDSPKLPILRATILESMRLASSIPTGIPHRLEEDMQYEGYHLPKNSTVLACDWALCNSPIMYPTPKAFSPERWLQPESPCYQKPLSIHPRIQGHSVFGYGRRVCIGQDYAAAQILTLCAAICSFFDFEMGLDSNGQRLRSQDCLDAATPHVIPIMSDVNVRFRARDSDCARRIEHLYHELELHDPEPWEDECL